MRYVFTITRKNAEGKSELFFEVIARTQFEAEEIAPVLFAKFKRGYEVTCALWKEVGQKIAAETLNR